MAERMRRTRPDARVLSIAHGPQAGQGHERPRRLFARAALTVVGFWWLATGLIVALQRVGVEWLLGAACAVAAVAGAVLAWRARTEATPASVRASFVGAALLWAAHQASFYGGWLVGPAPATGAAPPARSLALALEAMHATWYSDAVALLLLGGAALLARRAAHATVLWSLVAFWTMHQLARLCLFAGVVNPATRFLPDRLQYLARYFGPAENSAFLVAVAVALALVTARLVSDAVREPRVAVRERHALLAVLSGLATLEHVLLATTFTVPLWELFLWIRGA